MESIFCYGVEYDSLDSFAEFLKVKGSSIRKRLIKNETPEQIYKRFVCHVELDGFTFERISDIAKYLKMNSTALLNKLESGASWKNIIMEKYNLSRREQYSKIFKKPQLLKDYFGCDIRERYLNQMKGSWSQGKLEDYSEFSRRDNPQAKMLEELWETVRLQHYFENGNTRNVYRDKNHKYAFKKTRGSNCFQTMTEIDTFMTSNNPFFLPIEHVFTCRDGVILVFPYCDDEIEPDFLEEIIALTDKYEKGIWTLKNNVLIDYNGLRLGAGLTSWAYIDEIPIVFDYGEIKQ